MTGPEPHGLPTARPLAVELRRVEVPLVEPIVAAHGTESVRRSILVRVTDESGADGWGECVALSRPTYTPEWTDGAWLVLRDLLAPAAVAGADAGVRGHPMASAALESAVVDLPLRAAGTSLASALGATEERVRSRAVLGIEDDVDRLVERVAARCGAGHTAVKLKIQPGWDAEPVAAIRSTWPALDLAVDANGSYRLDRDLATLAGLDRHGLTYIEQPLPAGAWADHATLRRRLDTPIALDESVGELADLDLAVALGAVDVVNLKPGRLGGFAAAAAIHHRLVEHGLTGFCGGMYELGIARAGAMAVAALPGMGPTDLGPSGAYVVRDITAPFDLAPDGTIGCPSGPGIGRLPDPDQLDEVTVERVLIERVVIERG